MLSPWFGTRNIDDEASDEAAQIEAAVEPVSEGGEIGLGVLGVVEGVKGAGQGGLQVAQHGVDPGELGQIASLTYWGFPSSLSETAATKGTLFSEPRPGVPPLRSPPR